MRKIHLMLKTIVVATCVTLCACGGGDDPTSYVTPTPTPPTPTKVAVTSVTLDKTAISLVEDETQTLVATIVPTNATTKTVSWSSSNAGVASVDSNGKVTAVKAGEATITVTTTDGNKTATCKVTVTAKSVPVQSIALPDPATMPLLRPGEEMSLQPTVTPQEALATASFTWTSSDESIASVDKNGKVTSLAPGDVVITVSAENGSVKASYNLTVYIGFADKAVEAVALYEWDSNQDGALSLEEAQGWDVIYSHTFQGKGITSFEELRYFTSLTTIEPYAFADNPQLTSITLPGKVKEIGEGAFMNCTNMESVTIPEYVSSIGSAAFSNCSRLKTIVFYPTTPPSLGTDVFKGIPSDAVFYVPLASVNAYKADWKDYAGYIYDEKYNDTNNPYNNEPYAW